MTSGIHTNQRITWRVEGFLYLWGESPSEMATATERKKTRSIYLGLYANDTTMDLHVLRSPVSVDCDAPKQPRLRQVREGDEMKTITEADAKQLANLLGMWIAVDEDNDVYMFKNKPHIDGNVWNQYVSSIASDQMTKLFIRIASDRPWTEQIWRPE